MLTQFVTGIMIRLLAAGAATKPGTTPRWRSRHFCGIRVIGLIEGTLIEEFEGQELARKEQGWVFPVSAIGREGKRETVSALRSSHAVCG